MDEQLNYSQIKAENVKELQDEINVGMSVAKELLILSGNNVDLAQQASLMSSNLSECKARIIDMRFKLLEKAAICALNNIEDMKLKQLEEIILTNEGTN